MPLKKELGNALWLVLHSTAIQANEIPELIEHYQKMESNLAPLLPCPQCQGHYQENIKKEEYQNQPEPKHLNQINYIHNQVNSLFNKPTFTLDESTQFINQINKENPQLLQQQYFKVVLTISHYWGSFFWHRPKKRFRHNVKNFKAFLIHSMKLLSLAEPEEIQTYWKETENPFQTEKLYPFLVVHGLKKIPENFSFDFKGCGCLNK